jgi:hypothetical protein
MMYDFIVAALCVAGGAAIYYYMQARKMFQITSSVYFLKMSYALLSFPWLVFIVPIFESIITKSRPTAYTK